MKKLTLSCFFLISVATHGQNFPACDSLFINCCTFIQANPTAISLTASNNSSVLFDYPGFILFDNNGDTIAIETVNYFGIGSGPQVHTLDIIRPVSLPFSGYVNLYVLFYDTLACSFPVTIQDTVTSVKQLSIDEFYVYPNPVSRSQSVRIVCKKFNGQSLFIYDVTGRLIYQTDIKLPGQVIQVETGEILPGIYQVILKTNDRIIIKDLMIH